MRADWVECTFDEVLDIKNGKNQKLVEDLNGRYPIYGSSGVIGKANEYLCPENTTIIGRKGTINSPIYVTTKFWNVDTAFGLIPSDILNSKLLFYFCKYFNFHSLDKSTTIPSLAKTDLLKINFPLPPLPEQRAIVKKIEALFSSLDAGIADLRKAQDQLKIYRQAVLKKAFEGELMKDLGDFIIKIEAGKSFRCRESPPFDDEVGVLKVSAVTWGEFDEFESKTILEESRINADYFVKEGDFLLSRANTIDLVGNTVIVKKIKKCLMLSDKTLRLILDSSINKYYLLYYLRSRNGKKQIMELSTGNQESMRNISQGSIKKISFPFSSLEEQAQIVKEIESRLSVCDAVGQQIKDTLSQAEALRQSILKKAFEGRLLSEAEVTACQQEADYEPALVLLERIKATSTPLSGRQRKT